MSTRLESRTDYGSQKWYHALVMAGEVEGSFGFIHVLGVIMLGRSFLYWATEDSS